MAEFRCFYRPQQGEVVAVADEKFDELWKIERLRSAVRAPVLQRIPGLRAVEQNRAAIRILKIVMIG